MAECLYGRFIGGDVPSVNLLDAKVVVAGKRILCLCLTLIKLVVGQVRMHTTSRSFYLGRSTRAPEIEKCSSTSTVSFSLGRPAADKRSIGRVPLDIMYGLTLRWKLPPNHLLPASTFLVP
jgi:hypothetical protein